MFISRKDLKQRAKDALSGNWGTVIGALLIVGLISFVLGIIPIIGWLGAIFIVPTLNLGRIIIYLKLARQTEAQVGNVYDGFNFILKVFGLSIVIGLFVFLWSLLLFIPGIIATYKYSMAFNILVDNPDMGIMDCIKESKRITDGYKMDLFVLQLSFIGWNLLVPFTFGILSFWLIPYMEMTETMYYLELSK